MATFRIDQATPGAGIAGVSRHDLIDGEVISLVATEPTGPGVTYSWEIIDKVGSVASLTSTTGSSTSIGNAGQVTQPCSFLIQLAANDNGTITYQRLICSVVTATLGLRIPLFSETASPTGTLASNDPTESDDNAVYTDRAGLGVTEQNWRGWMEWVYQLTLHLESVSNNLPAASDIPNDSGVSGQTVADALDQLDSDVTAALGSLTASGIANDSTVSGTTVADALDTLAPALSSDGVANDSGVTGTTVSDALDNLEANLGVAYPILWSWNGTSLTQFDSVDSFSRSSGAGPNGSVTPSVIADPLYATRNVISLACSAIEGGFFLPIATSGLTLPAEFRVSAEFGMSANVSSFYIGFLAYYLNSGAVNGMTLVSTIPAASSSLYGGVVLADAGGTANQFASVSSSTATVANGKRIRIDATVALPHGTSTPEFSALLKCDPSAGYVQACSGSWATKPAALTTQWNSMTFDRLALLVGIESSGASPTIYARDIKVFSA